MRNRALARLKLFAAGLALAALLPGGARAADFSGKTIEFVIPFATAGGSDVWARFFAPYLSESLPGKPTVVVKNVPGGGSITGTNQFVQRAKPDGLSILGTSGSTSCPTFPTTRAYATSCRSSSPTWSRPTAAWFK